MSLNNLSDAQKRALVDLVVLGMCADGHLALRENTLLQRTLETLGFQEEYQRDAEIDASVSRVRGHGGRKEDAALYLKTAAQAFGSREDREIVQKLLTDMMQSDDKVTPEEETFLKSVFALLQ